MYNVSQVKQCILTTYNVLLSHSYIKLTCQDSLFSPTQVFRQPKKRYPSLSTVKIIFFLSKLNLSLQA